MNDDEGGAPGSAGEHEKQGEDSPGMDNMEILRELKDILELLKRGLPGGRDE